MELPSNILTNFIGDSFESGKVYLFRNKNHDKNAPYSFHPTRSKKLVANPYIDMGQGILECMKDIEKNSQEVQ